MKFLITFILIVIALPTWADAYYCEGESVIFTRHDIHGKTSTKVNNTFDLHYSFRKINNGWELIQLGPNKKLSRHCSLKSGIHTCQHVNNRGSFELFDNGIFIIMAYDMLPTDTGNKNLSAFVITGRCSRG